MHAAVLAVGTVQAVSAAVLLHRLWPGRRRRPPVAPLTSNKAAGLVSVVVATLNEAHRIRPCLEGLIAQGSALREIIVVDSNSTDGTRDIVREFASRDARLRLVTDPPLPEGWVGKVWALQYGLQEATGEWVLGIDADTRPHANLIDTVVACAIAEHFDVLSFSPRFVDQTAAERWLQPAMLLSLVYRTGAAGANTPPDRVLANGQCFLAKRSVLLANHGYESAKASFSDDVTLTRALAQRGARVGFLDGSRLIDVAAYRSMPEMWREWGRSFDLADSSRSSTRWFDLLFAWSVQGLPMVLLLVAVAMLARRPHDVWLQLFAGLNAALVAARIGMLFALRRSYAQRGIPYWLSFTADIPATIRLTLSTVRRPRKWRGRNY